MSEDDQAHIPVLLDEVIEALAPRDGARIIDATFGAGGYVRAILEAAKCDVVGLDRDPSAISAGAKLVRTYKPRLMLEHTAFDALLSWTESNETEHEYRARFDGVVFDLGVSSMQLDQVARGFSFRADGPLDMRMFAAPGFDDLKEQHPSAAEVVNSFEESQIADILFQLGEERRSRAIAKAIVARRASKPFSRTLELAGVISDVVGGGKPTGRHPATRSFQALRIFVNDEIGQLVRGLCGAERCLKPGGQLVVVTFHSLEDRIVKRFMALRSGKHSSVSRHLPAELDRESVSSFRIVNQRSLTSSKGEVAMNPRARSARLRVCTRTGAPAFPVSQSNLGVPGLVSVTVT